jgi:hypothetical protein
LVADGFSDTLRFRTSEEVATSPVYTLLRSPGRQQLALYAPGRYEDGWLGLLGSINLWPETTSEGLAGTLAFELTAPEGTEGRVTFRPQDGPAEEIVVAPGGTREVSFAVCADGPWEVAFDAPSTGSVGGRYVSVMSSEPTYRADPSACAAGSS